ncbi:hypothetical protein [Paenibacillus sp. Leaf72]|uniref:hypothetical protein n=1 Tax=Paenibacillus sp. Leaf72 TaxID=1736234 RepID=UPI0006F42B9A|nr:hypothetical protein [Paenibacillus sp. Leaf72]KQN96971.1 hypothetical protein ASF12_23165 [Paenibacillus sp. Leaf72]
MIYKIVLNKIRGNIRSSWKIYLVGYSFTLILCAITTISFGRAENMVRHLLDGVLGIFVGIMIAIVLLFFIENRKFNRAKIASEERDDVNQ